MFEIPLLSWLVASLLLLGVVWLFWYVRFLFNTRKEVKVSEYFQMMFKGLKNSELRVGWSATIFAIMYSIGLVITGFIKSAWYPAQWTRKLMGFIFFGQKRRDRINRDALKDKPKKKKDNGGVY